MSAGRKGGIEAATAFVEWSTFKSALSVFCVQNGAGAASVTPKEHFQRLRSAGVEADMGKGLVTSQSNAHTICKLAGFSRVLASVPMWCQPPTRAEWFKR